METLLTKIIEQNNRLIDLGEQTIGALNNLQDAVSDGLSAIEVQLLTNDPSSNVSSIEMDVREIVSKLSDILDKLTEQK